jgi:hypothetical protein
MYYEINVARDGMHFFATAKRSITDKDKLKEVYELLKNKFPVSDGYDISVYRVTEKIDSLAGEEIELLII